MSAAQESPEMRFTRLYQETRTDILAYLARRSMTLEDATDALAETYAAAWQKLDTLPEGDRARLWLFGAARNELRMAARRTQAGSDLTVELAEQLRLSNGEPADSDESSTDINAALAKLSRIDYEVVTLTAWEGLAPREIAAVLNLSANIVRIRLHRARANLRRQLRDSAPDTEIRAEPLIRETVT